MTSAVFFDWSGTLNNNVDAFCDVCDHMFKELGHKPISKTEIKRHFTIPYMRFWNRYFPDLTQEEESRLYTKYILLLGKAKPYLGVKKVLQELQSRNILLFVVSSDLKQTLFPEIESYGFLHFFSEVYADVYEKELVLGKILSSRGLDPKKCFFVGDTTGDIEAARRVGLKTVGIGWGFQHKSVLKKSAPDYLISRISDLRSIV